ncbi:hypothetical protein BKA70DRAFT_1115589, partial [Coprinopsis sp. MPI-PUGE-AT-0042]
MSRKAREGERGTRIKLQTEAPPLTVEGKEVTVVDHYKYLGVQVDAELRWNTQEMHAVERATKWVMLYKRLTKPSTGVRMQLMKQMYMAVGVPKMTYALDVWYRPPLKEEGKRRNTGSVRAMKMMTKVQRMATLAITGAMRSTATDVLDAHAGIPPT